MKRTRKEELTEEDLNKSMSAIDYNHLIIVDEKGSKVPKELTVDITPENESKMRKILDKIKSKVQSVSEKIKSKLPGKKKDEEGSENE